MSNIIKRQPTTKKHDFMAMELLCPNMDKTDSNRGYMFASSHLAQAVNLKEPEIPLVFTNFENEVGKYSDLGYNKVKEDTRVLARINKNKYNYYLLVHYLESDTYDILERREEFWLTEKYAFTFNNEIIDSLEPGDIIEKDTVYNKSYNYDENNNFRYGVNLRTIYYTDKCRTLEDPVVISKSAANKLTSYNVEVTTVMVNQNDLLLNLSDYPDSEYKTFPSIGEDVSSFLCVRRRINKEKIYLFDDLTLNSLRPEDEKIYGSGKVIDIDIYSNIPENELDGNYNKQICKEIKNRKKFNKEFLSITKDIVENMTDQCTSELIQIYNNIKLESAGAKFTYEDSVFDGINIKFTILNENKLAIGSKISGRYGKII